MRNFFAIALLIIFIFSCTKIYAMESTNYKIDADTISSGSGVGDSSNFSSSDSIGELYVGEGISDNFGTLGGFGSETNFGISLSLDYSTRNLGTLTAGTPITGLTTVTVVTDAWDGYDLAIYQDHNLMHTDNATMIPDYACSIDTPCDWTGNGLGFTIQSGTDVEEKWYMNPTHYYAAIPDSVYVFHEKKGYTSGDDSTVIEYKVDVPTAQKSGVYTNAVTYVATTRI